MANKKLIIGFATALLLLLSAVFCLERNSPTGSVESNASISYLYGVVTDIDGDSLLVSETSPDEKIHESLVVTCGPQATIDSICVGERIVVYYFPAKRDGNRIEAYEIGPWRENPSPQDFVTAVR